MSGPATPVVLNAQVLPSSDRTPTAIASAHAAETTPCSAITSADTPSSSDFTRVA